MLSVFGRFRRWASVLLGVGRVIKGKTLAVSAAAAPPSVCVDSPKTVRDVFRKPKPHWVGDGFHVFPVFEKNAFSQDLSPFLMFDYGAPREFPASPLKRRGVGNHPHRGFETVTIAFQGEIQHGDNNGNIGVIGPGDVQWMTAGRGIIHQEFHSDEFSQNGGVLEMCQLWVNLPAEYKMTAPKYQPIVKEDIPQVPLFSRECPEGVGQLTEEEEEVESSPEKKTLGGCRAGADAGHVRIIAGDFLGTKGPASTHTPINLWDVTVNEIGRTFDFDIVPGHNLAVFIRRGSCKVQGETLKLADVAIMSRDGSSLQLQALEDNTSILIMSGEPINEPIAHRGPFVMNTAEELKQARVDYGRRENGFE